GGIVHGDQRCRTGGLDVDARPVQVEQIRSPRRQEVLVVARVPKQEHADLIDELAVAAEVEVEIAPHAAAGEDADRPGRTLGWTSGILKRLPGAFEEVPVLGVHDGGILRAEAEELRIEIS